MSVRIDKVLVVSKWDQFSKVTRTYSLEKMGTEFYVTVGINVDWARRIHLEGAVAKDIESAFDRLCSEIVPIIRDCVDPSTKEG